MVLSLIDRLLRARHRSILHVSPRLVLRGNRGAGQQGFSPGLCGLVAMLFTAVP